MKTYEVRIQSTIIKNMTIEAETAEDAEILAHESFTVLNTQEDESYDQDTLEITEVTT